MGVFFSSPRCSVASQLHRRVPPCAVKACAVHPVFARVVRKLGAVDPRIRSKGHERKILGQGHSLRLLDEAREVGHHQHPGPENQDNQHMIDQPRGSFPDYRSL